MHASLVPSISISNLLHGLIDKFGLHWCAGCTTFWCPCITFGQIAEIVDKGSTCKHRFLIFLINLEEWLINRPRYIWLRFNIFYAQLVVQVEHYTHLYFVWLAVLASIHASTAPKWGSSTLLTRALVVIVWFIASASTALCARSTASSELAVSTWPSVPTYSLLTCRSLINWIFSSTESILSLRRKTMFLVYSNQVDGRRRWIIL